LDAAPSEPVATALTNQPSTPSVAAVTNREPLPTGELDLENATGKIVSTAVPAKSDLSSTAAEIVKLAQAGVDEGVMLAFVTNSPHIFNLTSDQIIYLNDIGVPESVVAAMILRDQANRSGSAGTELATAETNQLIPLPGAPTPYPTSTATQDTTMVEAEAEPMVDPIAEPQPVNVSYTYFYESLAPYGSWINVSGYGLCWQPTVVVVNPGWRPYGDNGRWVYSNCGWYWSSSYSWGWAPFHYGRWFQHSRWGWCWAPDTVWGPSWVSWRYTPGYCGWAPLPPSACYTPGSGFTYWGRHVGNNCGFGLTASHYSFVPAGKFVDRSPSRHRLPQHESIRVFNSTTPASHVLQVDGRTINHQSRHSGKPCRLGHGNGHSTGADSNHSDSVRRKNRRRRPGPNLDGVPTKHAFAHP
jgi:hypothetical protein